MKQLPPAHLKVLVELRYMLKDGEARPISNATLKTRTGYSEGYISVLVRQLAGVTVTMHSNGQLLIYPALPQRFIERTWSEADGGFVITMLPPPELRAPAPLPRSAGDHGHDPLPEAAYTASECVETLQPGDHAHDPSIHYTYRHAQQQPASSDDAVAADPPAGDEDAAAPDSPVAPAGLSGEDNHSSTVTERPTQVYLQQWRQILAANPGYTAQDFAQDLAHASARADVKSPLRLVVGVRARGECVYAQAEIDARAATLPHDDQPPATALWRARRARSDRAAFAHHIPPAVISADDVARTQQLAERARALAPPQSADVDLVYLMELFAGGATDAAALAALTAAHAADGWSRGGDM
jgi:hypothetical protein